MRRTAISVPGSEPTTAADLSYAEAVGAIESRGRYGIRLGLGRVRALLRAVGDPQRFGIVEFDEQGRAISSAY